MQKHCSSRIANFLVQMSTSETISLQVERVRLNYKSAGMRRPSREQEVLHYQWFADLGSVEAQRAVGQIFSHGALRNPEQALRYFR
jgi:TPR repeat protein